MKTKSKLVQTTIFALMGFLCAFLNFNLISTPVFADPVETTETAETTETETNNNSTEIATENTENTEDTNNTENTENTETCYDQSEALGWVICPTTNVIAKFVDSIYSIIDGLLVIKPLTTDTDSPIHIVWEYVRNITNIIFIIFLIIIIYSQLTGVGINNYGIKKTLPRLIIAAILVNLSFVICSLSVDISNILGASLKGFFDNIGNQINQVDTSWGLLTNLLVGGGGTLTVGATIITVGGFAAFLWMLVPIIIGAALAVITGLIMIGLRHALVILLIMIAPLAFVAYLLPNTERLFAKWKNLFIAMLVFYPMFSVLYGASNLAGASIIASADNIFWVILGLAVQTLPLFLSIPLMKTSGTFLDRASQGLSKLSTAGRSATSSYASTYRARARAKYLGDQAGTSKYNLPRRTAQALAKRSFRRNYDAAYWENLAKQSNQAFATNYTHSDSWLNRKLKRNGTPTKRGEKLYESQAQSLAAEATIKANATDFDEGFTHKAKNERQKARLDRADTKVIDASDKLKFENARALDVNLANLESYEQRVNEALDANAQGQFSARYNSMVSTAGIRGQNGINSIVANAIASKAKVRQEITGDYLSLFNEASYSSNVYRYLENALRGGNENAMSAAIDVIMLRGDTDIVMDKLANWSDEIKEINPENLAMQKRLCDTLIRYKGDNAVLWGYAKCNNKARGKAEGARNKIEERLISGEITQAEANQLYSEVQPDFFTFADYLDPNGKAAKYNLDAETILNEFKEKDIAAVQDKTVFDYLRDHDRLIFTEKQRRDGLFSYAPEGEPLRYLIDLHLGSGGTWNDAASGSDKKTRKVLTFKDQAALDYAKQNANALISDCTSAQIASFKSDALYTFATVLSDMGQVQPDGRIVFDISDSTKRHDVVVSGIRNMTFRPNITTDLANRARRGQLDSMNVKVRDLMNEVLHFE